jgi:hypothetical protein
VDRRQIKERYQAAYVDAQPQGNNEQGSTNARLPLKQDADARADALHETLKGYLKLIGEKQWGEVLPMIRSALLWSRATSGVVKVLNTDTTSPETILDLSGPSGTVNTKSARFTFSSSDADVVSFECSLDGGSFESCTSPKDYTNLSEGQHTFSVRAVDKAGNADLTPASRTWTVDTVAPEGTVVIDGGAAYSRSTTVNLTLSATDPSPGSGVASMRFSQEGQFWSDWESFAASKSWTLAGGDGTKTVHVQFRDNAGNVSAIAQAAIQLDIAAPKVTGATPANNATGIKRNTNLTATFSEKMDPSTITKSTFKLFKVNTDGSTTQITNVTVTPSSDRLKATLNPFGTSTTLLAKSTRYKAVVTTGAKDVAGNPLDQNPTTSGNQQMVWSFKTGLQ